MSKVIRISDTIFSRLQQYSTPLVDTPASVIERVLDYYEKSHRFEKRSSTSHSPTNTKQEVNKIGLYLAPASKENLETTIIKSKPLIVAKSNLSQEQFKALEHGLKGKEKIHCWAMTKNSRSKFNAMNKGDLVLFTSKGTGRFSYIAKVIYKLESALLGEALWSVVPGLPWELIYFLEDINRINVPKEKLVSALGYDQGYVVPGIVRVSSERVQNIINVYGSIPKLISALT